MFSSRTDVMAMAGAHPESELHRILQSSIPSTKNILNYAGSRTHSTRFQEKVLRFPRAEVRFCTCRPHFTITSRNMRVSAHENHHISSFESSQAANFCTPSRGFEGYFLRFPSRPRRKVHKICGFLYANSVISRKITSKTS